MDMGKICSGCAQPLIAGIVCGNSSCCYYSVFGGYEDEIAIKEKETKRFKETLTTFFRGMIGSR